MVTSDIHVGPYTLQMMREMAANRIRIGVVGCGLIAQVMHIPHLRSRSDLWDLRALCDISPATLNAVAEVTSVRRRFTRWDALLEEPLDAVMILTSGSHAEPAVSFAKRGLHVFVEKPLCLRLEDGIEMRAAAERARIQLMVGYMKRYDPAYRRLVAQFEGEADTRLVTATTLQAPEEPYLRHHRIFRPPREQPEVSALLAMLRERDDQLIAQTLGTQDPFTLRMYEDVLLGSMVHDLNAVRGVLGEPQRLEFAQITSTGVTAVFTYQASRVVHTWTDLPGIARYRQAFSFYAPSRRGTLVFPSPYLRNLPTALSIEEGEVDSPRSWETSETVSYEEAFALELEEFHAAIVQGRPPLTNVTDGLRDVALCQSIVTGHLTGRPVDHPSSLPEQPDGASA